jgi:hypothetical protein
MKHGDKKQKTAKAISKASVKKASAPDRAGSDSRKKATSAAAGKAAPRPATAAKTSGREKPETPGKRKAVSGPAELTFSNPLVGSAFKRVVKKYPIALKRLVD